jgi:hypothetical protein
LLEALEADKVGGLLGRDLDLLISCKGFCKEDAISMGRQRAAMLAVVAVGLAMLVVVALEAALLTLLEVLEVDKVRHGG